MGGLEGMNVKRGQLKASVTRFGNFLRGENVDPVEPKARRKKIEVYVEFEQVQAYIELEAGDQGVCTYTW